MAQEPCSSNRRPKPSLNVQTLNSFHQAAPAILDRLSAPQAPAGKIGLGFTRPNGCKNQVFQKTP